jgi:hypothetical protein
VTNKEFFPADIDPAFTTIYLFNMHV